MSHNPYATQPPDTQAPRYMRPDRRCGCPELTHNHGCRNRYLAGCRCDECRNKEARHRRHRRPKTPYPCYCRPTPRYERGRYRQHRHGCWGRYRSEIDTCRCRRCSRAYYRHLNDLLAARPDEVVIDRLVAGWPVEHPRASERVAAVLRLRELGYSVRDTALRVGLTPRTVQRILARTPGARLEVAA